MPWSRKWVTRHQHHEHPNSYCHVSRAGVTPGAIRAACAAVFIAVLKAAWASWRRAATDCKAALVNIDNRCKQQQLQRIYCSDPPT